MTIRARFEKLIDDALTMFPNGALFPQGPLLPIADARPAVVTDLKEISQNEDGTFSVELTITELSDMERARVRQAVEDYLESLKTVGSVVFYQVSSNKDRNPE